MKTASPGPLLGWLPLPPLAGGERPAPAPSRPAFTTALYLATWLLGILAALL